MQIENLIITKKGPRKKGWTHYVIRRFSSIPRPKKLRMSEGGFVTMKKVRNVFHLSWNGKQFFKGIEYETLKKEFPKLLSKIEKRIKEGLK